MSTDTSALKSRWRNVLGQYPTGVAIVSTVDAEGSPVGMVVGSFASVSESPPLVSFMPMVTAYTASVVRETGRFRVSVLGAGHEELCRTFFRGSPEERFAGEGWELDSHGIPRLRDAIAWFDCRVVDMHEAGDHYIVVGEVQDLGIGETAGGMPLVFLKGGYGTFTVPRLEIDPARLGSQIRLATGVTDALEDFAARIGMECQLSARVQDSVVVLAAANLRANVVGFTFPFAAPMAPVLAAWANDEQRAVWLRRSRDLLGDVDGGMLEDFLARTRARGFGVSFGQGMRTSRLMVPLINGADHATLAALWADILADVREYRLSENPEEYVATIQVPIFDADREVAMDLVVSGFGETRTRERYDSVVSAALELGAELTGMLGGRAPEDYVPDGPVTE